MICLIVCVHQKGTSSIQSVWTTLSLSYTVFVIMGSPFLTYLSSPSVAKGQSARVPSFSSLTYRTLGVTAAPGTPSSSLISMHS